MINAQVLFNSSNIQHLKFHIIQILKVNYISNQMNNYQMNHRFLILIQKLNQYQFYYDFYSILLKFHFIMIKCQQIIY